MYITLFGNLIRQVVGGRDPRKGFAKIGQFSTRTQVDFSLIFLFLKLYKAPKVIYLSFIFLCHGRFSAARGL